MHWSCKHALTALAVLAASACAFAVISTGCGDREWDNIYDPDHNRWAAEIDTLDPACWNSSQLGEMQLNPHPLIVGYQSAAGPTAIYLNFQTGDLNPDSVAAGALHLWVTGVGGPARVVLWQDPGDPPYHFTCEIPYGALATLCTIPVGVTDGPLDLELDQTVLNAALALPSERAYIWLIICPLARCPDSESQNWRFTPEATRLSLTSLRRKT